jgi:hypothetical protein
MTEESKEEIRANIKRVARERLVSLCLNGKCDCESASKCKFTRCDNCDYPIDSITHKSLVDHYCEDHNICPMCDGPLNERRINGPLVD